jgi:hypothetical protein
MLDLILCLWQPLAVGIIVFILLQLLPNPASQCPHCRKFGVKETLREDLVGIFEKGVQFGRDYRVIPHEKYELYHRCKSCGYEWMTTRIQRL